MAIQDSNKYFAVYTLKDPVTSDVYYVGCATDIKRRLRYHIRNARRGTRKSQLWIMSLIARGLTPLLEIVEEGSGVTWKEREKYWIAFYRSLGADLTNQTDGGEGSLGFRHSEKTKNKWSALRSGTPPSDRTLERAREVNLGRKFSEEFCMKVSEGKKRANFHFSAESRAKMSASRKAYYERLRQERDSEKPSSN